MTGIKNCSSDNSAARSASSSRLATASDKNLLAIKEQLCGQSACLQIIPIVGMGGIGKTTLARNAYHDPLIRDVFHIGGWVTVSQSYNLDDILSSLHQSLKLFDAKRLEESHGSEDDVSEQAIDELASDLFEEIDESEFPEEDVHEQANYFFEENDESEFPDEEKTEPPAKVFEESHVYEQANDLFEENDESEFPDAKRPESPAKVFEEVFEEGHGSEEDVYEQATDELTNDLFEENDESEYPDAKRPKSPAKVFEESHGSEEDVYEQATEEPVNDLFEENDESEFPDAKRPKSPAKVGNSKRPKPVRNSKWLKSPAKVFEEDFYEEESVFEENDESEFPDAKRPKSRAKVGNSKRPKPVGNSKWLKSPAKVFEEDFYEEKSVDEYFYEEKSVFEENDESEVPESEYFYEEKSVFEENDESEFPDVKRPKSRAKVGNSRRSKPVGNSKWLKSPAKVFEEYFYEENSVFEENDEVKSVEENNEYAAKVFPQSPESIGDQVYKTLKGRKYVIVMDDIWNSEVCDHLNRVFPDDHNGSRIILTTRLHDVATYAENCSPHEMQLLPENESWDLLRRTVFTSGVCNHELENIGMSIARSCGGLPLAIVVIAGLLATVEKTQASWEEIAEKVNSTIAAKDGQFEKILSLSYTHLPRHLRQCFVYMGGFPEDREIHVAKLIKLWVAEGFVGAITASKSLEEEAEECLQDLIKRSLVLVGMRKPHGEIKSCSLHDLMRDLCVRKADEEKFPLHDMNAGRTLVERYKEGSFEDVRHLRVMEIEKGVLYPPSAGVELYFWVTEQIFRLSKLRYLALAYFVEIPTALSYLENLQTLIIYTTEGLVCLPPEIWRMPQLRHLVSSFDKLPYPEGEANLETLQTLYEVRNLQCTDNFMAMIPNIKKLGLFYCASYEFEAACNLDIYGCLLELENNFHHGPPHDYHLENLECLHQLEKLKLRVYPGFQGIINPVFPQSLKKLSLSGWRFPSWKDMTVVGSLPNLQVLKLTDSGGQDGKWETSEGEFARLSFLLIERSDLREWITEPEHFPNLKQLRLHYCSYLDEIPVGIGDILTLELIEVKEGSTLLVESAKGIGEEQKDMGNDCLQVHATCCTTCCTF